ncbi:MAG: ThiF family adenylyltransferase [Methanomassiliicoccales archaeon]|nr:MAG: ThiF family adenylyltransferase [Methanomassiliicoccales archaeon]
MPKKRVNRYARQIILEEIGEDGQKVLGRSSALIVGCGALGGVIADHLTRAGVGKITIVDRDIIALENLQRQILFDESDIGIPKAVAASKKLQQINSEVVIEAIVKDFNPNNAEKTLGSANIILDGTDNMETRYLINDVSVKNEIPWVYGGAVSTYGMSMNVVPKKTACLSCAFPHMPKAGSLPTCDTVGVLNTVPSIIASIQATEALKILLKKEYSHDLIVYDVWGHDFKRIKIKRSSNCKCCAELDFEYLNAEKMEVATTLCGSNSVQITPAVEGEVSLERLAKRLKNAGDVTLSPVHLIFEAEEVTISVFKDGRAILKGTDDETLAKSLYAKYIGN